MINSEPKTITKHQMCAEKESVDINISCCNSTCTSQLTRGIHIPVCFIAHMFFPPLNDILVRKIKKINQFLVQISALKTTDKQNDRYLLPLVSDKYLKALGSSPTGKQQRGNPKTKWLCRG